jgi:hypothetical protein
MRTEDLFALLSFQERECREPVAIAVRMEVWHPETITANLFAFLLIVMILHFKFEFHHL